MGEILDDPNRQAVGLEPAWVEGNGGSDNLSGAGTTAAKASATTSGYRTKAELLEAALALDLDVDESMTRAEIEAALEGKEG